MKFTVRQDLVYDRTSANLTSIEEDLKNLESEGVLFPEAKQMLILMVQSIFSGKLFPVVHFATTGIQLLACVHNTV